MEVRCTGCNKLFRVSDDKISGSGVKFGCTRCSQTVKITKEDFEQYKLSREAASALASFEPKPAQTAPGAPAAGLKKASPTPETAPDLSVFDLSEPAAAAAALQQEEEAPPVFVHPETPVKPAADPAPVFLEPEPKKESIAEAKAQPKPAPVPPPKAEIKAPAKPKPEPVHSPVSPVAPTAPKEAARPARSIMDGAPQHPAGSSGRGKKVFLVLTFLLVIAAAGAYGVKWYLQGASQRVVDAAKEMTSPEGMQVLNASGAIDPGNGDLIISGVIENSTDTLKHAWYVLAEVYDAQTSVLITGKSVSGKQLYTRRDYEIMVKRGMNIQDIKMRIMQEQGVIIPPKGSVNFEIRIMEPPVGVASFNATLQPFDPVQLFKEMAEEQK